VPLERYSVGAFFEGEDGSVNFGMRDPDSGLIVPCRVSNESITALCGDEGERHRLEDFESCRDRVEATASTLFDRLDKPGSVFVTTDDFLA